MTDDAARIVVLGTGGTIAGAGGSADDPMGYRAGEIGVAQLLAAVPALESVPLVAEQVAQIDSKDMTFGVWRALVARCAHWLAEPDVRGIVITHGTDTVEETAFFLSCVLRTHKPVVLTCAMRPATAPEPDGPRNLHDAVRVACDPAAGGVLVVCAREVHDALHVRKAHPQRLDAFSSGDAGPLAQIDEDAVIWQRKVPLALVDEAYPAIERVVNATSWPRVEIVLNHAGADGTIVRALLATGIEGIVAAGTGNGTLHHDLEAALVAAQAQGVRVVRATRCTEGRVRPRPGDVFEPAGELSPVKARIALLLRLLDR